MNTLTAIAKRINAPTQVGKQATKLERKVRQFVPELTPLQTCGNRRNRLVALILP